MSESRLKTVEESQLQVRTRTALDKVRLNGKLADVYLQFANSEAALCAYLTMEAALTQGSLSVVELECVKLLVSQHTDCQFCLAVHSLKLTAAGVSPERQLAVRSGARLQDARLDALLDIARTLVQKPGALSDELLAAARAAGISDTELVDLAMAISTIFFTNITNHINDTPLTVAAAPPLPSPR